MVGQVNFFYCIEKTKFLQLKFTSAKKKKNTYSYIGPNASDKHKRKKKKKEKKTSVKGKPGDEMPKF